MSDPMEAITRLKDALAREVEPLGLTVQMFQVIPPHHGSPPLAQVVLSIGENALKTPEEIEAEEEEKRIAAEFEKIVLESAVDERKNKTEMSMERMARWAAGDFSDEDDGGDDNVGNA